MEYKIIIVLLISLFLLGCTSQDDAKVCFGRDCFGVEVAVTQAEHAKGLMERESLGRNKGMLFIFEKADYYTFWMKDTLIPLDIIWIDENKEVVFISKDTQPCEEDPCPSFGPGKPAKYVLEINSGMADKIGISEGDTAIINVG